MRHWLLLVLLAGAAGADELTLTEQKNLSLERCLALPPGEIVTRCPNVAGRFLEIDKSRLALVDRTDQKKGTLLCEDSGGWRCRRIVVLEYEMRGARKRDAKNFISAGELLRQFAAAPRVKLGEEFGVLVAPGLPPRTCLESTSRGCAVQAARLRVRAPDKLGAPTVRRRLWLVEDADGPTLTCSDAALSRCDELDAATWSALALTLRPSSLAPSEPPPELDVPEARTDKRPGLALEGGETSAGANDAWLRPKNAAALPRIPARADLTKSAHALEKAGGPCLDVAAASVAVAVMFSGEGTLISLTSEGAPAEQLTCLTQAAKKLAFPRFAGASYTLSALVIPTPKARSRTRAARPPRSR